MSTDPTFANPPKQGMSGTTKVVLGVGCGCGFLILLACGGMMLFSYFAKGMLEGMVSKDPAVIEKLRDEDICTMDVPAKLKPEASFNLTPPVMGHLGSAVFYGDDGKHDALVLIGTDEAHVEKANADQIMTQMEEGIAKERKKKAIRVESTSEHEVTINGEPAKFTIEEGVGENNEKRWHVNGEFAGKKGPAALEFEAAGDDFTKEEIEAMLDSIK